MAVGSLLHQKQLALIRFSYAQAPGHFVVKKYFTRDVGLYPFAIDPELWDGPLASVSEDLIHSPGVDSMSTSL
jgi:hypothetical protein